MRFPSFNTFTKALNDFKQDAETKIKEFKNDYAKLDKSIKRIAIPLFPPPFNIIADHIYNSCKGSEEDKTKEVLDYFNNLEGRGEQHYNQISIQLDSILVEIDDVKKIAAKETTVKIIRDILISTGNDTNKKLYELKDEVIQIKGTVDQFKKTTDDTQHDMEEIKQKANVILQKLIEHKQVQNQNFNTLGIKSDLREEEKIEIPEEMQLEISKRDKQIAELRLELERLREKVSLDSDYLLRLGNFFFYSNNHEKAIEHYDRILEQDPKRVYALYNKGLTLDKLCRYEEAITYYDKVLAIDPKYTHALYNKGLTLASLGRYEEAITYYDKVLAIDLNHPKAWNNKGILLDNLGKYQEAIECYNKVIRLDPNDAKALYNKGISLDNLAKYQQAIECYDKVIRLHPNYVDAWNNKCLTLYNLGKYQEAMSNVMIKFYGFILMMLKHGKTKLSS